MSKKSKKKPDLPASEDSVGYRKPPKSGQFRPGQSGNPGGRKKGSVNLKTILTAIMESEIVITENGRERSLPLVSAILKRHAQEALRGRHAAIIDLLDRYERYGGAETPAVEELPQEDQDVLDQALRRSRPVRSRGDAASEGRLGCGRHPGDDRSGGEDE